MGCLHIKGALPICRENVFTVTATTILDLEAQFNERAERWERESSVHSSPGARYLHKDYISIMTKGEAVVPLILKDYNTLKKIGYGA